MKKNFDDFSKVITSAFKSGKASGMDNISARDLKLNEKVSNRGLISSPYKNHQIRDFPNKMEDCKKNSHVSSRKGRQKSAQTIAQFLYYRYQAKLVKDSFATNCRVMFKHSIYRVKTNGTLRLKEALNTYLYISHVVLLKKLVAFQVIFTTTSPDEGSEAIYSCKQRKL